MHVNKVISWTAAGSLVSAAADCPGSLEVRDAGDDSLSRASPSASPRLSSV